MVVRDFSDFLHYLEPSDGLRWPSYGSLVVKIGPNPKKIHDRMFALYRVTTWLLVIFLTFYTSWNLPMASNGTQMGHSRSEQVPTNFFYMSEGLLYIG